MNRATWAELRKHGVIDKTQLVLEFTYLADGVDAAETLAGFLGDATDYEVRASEKSVEGSTQAAPIDLAVLDQWVEWMVLAGFENGRCRFDGWGTQLP